MPTKKKEKEATEKINKQVKKTKHLYF